MENYCDDCAYEMDDDDIMYATVTGFPNLCKSCYDNFHYGEEPADE